MRTNTSNCCLGLQWDLWVSWDLSRLDRIFNLSGNLGTNGVDNMFYLGLQYTLGAVCSTRPVVSAAFAKRHSLGRDSETLRRQLPKVYTGEWLDYLANLPWQATPMTKTQSPATTL